ncbi:MAG: FAD-dependent oxidoreductase [Actinomycetaceae bacterium]|nr:FAD-dependent oxidoreductase [Actinomycetaceae bacterium]
MTTGLDTPYDLLVLGGGLAGLSVAYKAACRGRSVGVLEARGRAGGLVASHVFEGLRVDVGAESCASSKGGVLVRELCAELGLETVEPQGQSWVWSNGADGPVPLPYGIVGIPADLHDPDVIAALRQAGGQAAVDRALEDLVLGPEVGAEAETIAELVEMRMGPAVLDLFVQPIAGGIYSADPALLSIERVAPGLKEAMLSAESLSGAVAALKAAGPKGAAVFSTKGGMWRLPAALVDSIESHGGRVITDTKVVGLCWVAASRLWHVQVEVKSPSGEKTEETYVAKKLNLALPPHKVFALLKEAAEDALGQGAAEDAVAWADILELCDFDWTHKGAPVMHVTLCLPGDSLEGAPRGSGMLIGPGGPLDPASPYPRRPKALTHYSAKWPDTVEDSDMHVLRVSYGRAGEDAMLPTVSEACAHASTLLGVDITPDSLLDSRVINWSGTMHVSTPQAVEVAARMREILDGVSALSISGAWFAGSGLAAVIPDALRTGETL